MRPHTIRYTVKPEEVEHNDELLSALFSELDEVRPPGLRYTAFKLDDGRSYLHFVWMDAEKGHRTLGQLKELRGFHAGLRERCDEGPTRTELSELGSYRLFSPGQIRTAATT